MKIKIGETQARVLIDVVEEREPRIVIRSNWRNINKSNEVAFKPAEELKVGNEIRVTVEKISDAPKKDAKKGNE